MPVRTYPTAELGRILWPDWVGLVAQALEKAVPIFRPPNPGMAEIPVETPAHQPNLHTRAIGQYVKAVFRMIVHEQALSGTIV